MRNPLVAMGAAREAISDWEELRIKTALGHRLARRSRVVIVRPWWMPTRLHIWLLSTIIAEEA